MTPIEIIASAHVAATVLVGAVHAVIIGLGLRAMSRAADARDRALTNQEQAANQRHAEAMRALDALIAGQREQGAALREQGAALRKQGEAFRELAASLREQREASREQGAALTALVARTAPAAG